MMSDILALIYPWVKSLHLIAVISWMAGLLYLPRLFVYHTEAAENDPQRAVFSKMETRLLRMIMNPAMIATWVFGLTLVLTPGIVDWSVGWPWVKAAMVILLSWFHHWLGRQRSMLAKGTCAVPARRFRLMNELPTAAMVVIVVMVIARPF